MTAPHYYVRSATLLVVAGVLVGFAVTHFATGHLLSGAACLVTTGLVLGVVRWRSAHATP
jgi:hypothetical protein